MNAEFMETVDRELREIAFRDSNSFRADLTNLISDLKEKSRSLNVNLFNSPKLTVDDVDMYLGRFIENRST